MLRLTIAIACVFSACAKAPAHVKATEVAMKKYCKHVTETKSLTILGSGGFFEADHVRGFYADFESNEQLGKEEAKVLLTGLVETCLIDLNKDEDVLKHFTNGPVEQKHISISVGFVGDDRKPYAELSQIHLFENKIFYSTYDPNQKTYVCTQTEALELATIPEAIPEAIPEENSMESEQELGIPALES